MATVVFVPYPETGHLNPTFKIARALKRQGHRVVYIGLLDFEEYVRAQGLEFFPIFKQMCPRGFLLQQAVNKNMENFEAILLRARNANQGGGFNPFMEIAAGVQTIRPDLMIIDLLLPDLAAMLRQVAMPLVLLNTQLFNPWEDEEMRAGYEPLTGLTELILCPQVFDFPETKRSRYCHYVEASIDLERNEAPFPWHKLDEQKPLIYCSFGSQSHLIENSKKLFQSLIDAMALKPDWQLVLAVGSKFTVDGFHAVSPNVILVNTAPQLAILKRAAITITHGGFNSVKESIYFGVPMIVFSLIRDHPAITARVAFHGLGVKGNIHKVSLEQILSLIDQLHKNQSYKKEIEAMAEVFRQTEEAQNGVKIIEEILTQLPGRSRSEIHMNVR
jgi:zeaxanthin glucosyltransferase